MNKILNESSVSIAVRVAKGAALYRRIQEEKANDKRLAFDQYIGEQLEAAGESKTLLSDPYTREVLEKQFLPTFQYQESAQTISKLAAMQAEADAILPAHVASERWATGDCQCVLERIYDKRDMENTVQTFKALTCPAHHDLTTLEEVHDTIKKETLQRGALHRHLMENFEGVLTTKKAGINPETGKEYAPEMKEGVEIEFEWEGTGKNRVPKEKVKGAELSLAQKAAVKTFRDGAMKLIR